MIENRENVDVSESALISDKATIRIDSGGYLKVLPGAKIDDDVRIVISSTGSVTIGRNSKIGKGTMLNCGGEILIEDSVSIYGYCILQSSIWRIDGENRLYKHGKVHLKGKSIISPYCLLSMDSIVEENEIVPPYSKLGVWLSD
ncbi:hypothetical protein ACFOEK_04655 [Litoribrevibacter euphylliae]|uniref:Acyltransferase n=1 Tax=Litoribrevibacter euphylliae TaxID=1834034 RepID=A0ABV7HCE7_9GAMM